MRRINTLIVTLCVFIGSVSAQDLLVKCNGDKMKVQVLEVSESRIKFVRYGTKAPLYSLPLTEIDYIEYADSTKERFSKPDIQLTEQTVEQQQAPSTSEVYDIGSYYSKNGVEGVVIATTDGGLHGTILSLDEGVVEWSTLDKKSLKHCGCTDKTDGRKNMEALAAFITSNNLSWSDFPAAEWCRNKGEGWYLPALVEVWHLGTIVNGGSRTTPKRDVRKQYNALLKSCGGKPINPIMYYHSSTEAEDYKYIMHSHCSPDTPHTGESRKSDKLFVRAFYRF